MTIITTTTTTTTIMIIIREITLFIYSSFDENKIK